MICIKVEIPKELNDIEDGLKGMSKAERETVYQKYQT